MAGGTTVTVRWFGIRVARRRYDQAARKIMPKLGRQVIKAGEIIIGAARREFKGSRTSALYKIVGGRKVRRQGLSRKQKTGRGYVLRGVTAPADKLAVFTGQYRKSITQSVTRRGRHKWNTEVGPTVKYARPHELGIRPMPKRQVLTPAVEKTKEQQFRILGRTFDVVT